MANRKISELPVVASALDGTETFPIVQSGVTRKALISSVAALHRLTENTSFYVTTGGSNTTGNGTVSKPWATLQYAIDWLTQNINAAGFIVTISLGTGTFVGAGLKNITGASHVVIKGAGVASTIITNGPNDGFYNTGACIEANVALQNEYWLNLVTIDGSGGTKPCILTGLLVYIIFGEPLLTAATINFVGPPGKYIIETFGGNIDDCPGVPSTIGLSGSCSGYVKCSDHSEITVQSHYTVSGTPAYSSPFIECYNKGLVICNNQTSFTGSATGQRFLVDINSAIVQVGSINLFPGNVAGTATNGGQYIL